MEKKIETYWLKPLITNRLPILLILFVALVSTYKTLGFYFWHDDFSVLYEVRNPTGCTFKWPYVSLCPLFSFLESVFHYSANAYFLLGFLAFVFACLSFYFLATGLFSKKTSLLTTLIFSTGYIGAGTFLEAWDSITLYPMLAFLFITLGFILRIEKKGIKPHFLILSSAAFISSLIIFHARSAMNIGVVVLMIILFVKGGIKNKLFLSFLFTILFILFFFIIPLGPKQSIAGFRLFKGQAVAIDPWQEIVDFLRNFGSILFTQDVGRISFFKLSQAKADSLRLWAGALAAIVFSFLTLKDFKKGALLKTRLFALVWIALLYFPYGVRSWWVLRSTHRYILPMYPGVLLAWATLKSWKPWRVLSVFLIVSGIVQNTVFLDDYLKYGCERREFYSQLHQQLPNLKKNSVLFFDLAPQTANQAGDFFRVGLRPAEAAVAAEYAGNFEDIELTTQGDVFRRILDSGVYATDQIYTFSYNGDELVNTTQASRNLIRTAKLSADQVVGESRQTEFKKDEALTYWQGVNQPVEFMGGAKPVLPARMKLKVKADFLTPPLPYKQDCDGCSGDVPEASGDYLVYLAQSKRLKRMVSIEASDSGGETAIANVIDGDMKTYWMAKRGKWVVNKLTSLLTISFPVPVSLDGLLVYAGPSTTQPTKFKVKVDGVEVENSVREEKTAVRILFTARQAKKLEIEILETREADAPLFYELDIIPMGFGGIDLSVADEINQFPAVDLQTLKQVKDLKDFLATGASACLAWESEGYGSGTMTFDLFVDGQFHDYELEIPAMGTNEPRFSLGCTNYPVRLQVASYRIEY